MSLVDNNWVLELPTQIFTLVKTRVNKKINTSSLATKFKDTFWTMDNAVNIEPKFPTVYMFFESSEIGNDLMNTDINAIICMAQIDITVSKDLGLNGAKTLAGLCMNEFKALGFNIKEAPNFNDNTIDIKRIVFRAERVIGQADIIFS